MKKSLILSIIILALIARINASAQTKPVLKQYPDTLQIVLTRQDAPAVIDKLKLAYAATDASDVISSKQANETKGVLLFIIQSVYRKWPELAPKEGKK